MSGNAAAVFPHVVPLAIARRPRPEQRVAYELAKLRIADTREPDPRLAHLVSPRG